MRLKDYQVLPAINTHLYLVTLDINYVEAQLRKTTG